MIFKLPSLSNLDQEIRLCTSSVRLEIICIRNQMIHACRRMNEIQEWNSSACQKKSVEDRFKSRCYQFFSLSLSLKINILNSTTFSPQAKWQPTRNLNCQIKNTTSRYILKLFQPNEHFICLACIQSEHMKNHRILSF